ncbi:hypothetical protein [Leptolyngbya sp. GB1-A1]|uniref:hypothetical protein n=1 Tax=unclassified Leptolyngbya TaxID=2650499 RepID=UPI0019982AB5|nr:hypothetical protein [Cyanobacteria bacterium FACHB-502]
MDRSKLVAIITGVIALMISIAYLLLVQFLDFRGEMVPAPLDMSALLTPDCYLSFLSFPVRPL